MNRSGNGFSSNFSFLNFFFFLHVIFIQSQDIQSGSKASPTSFTKTDVSPKGDERRGSRARSFVDEDVPLTHKTGTVGIVALAIRNKNETKKEREFKARLLYA